MTQEEKNLLLKDLCARLPYRVKAQCGSSETNIGEIVGVNVQRGQIKTRINFYNIEHIKPYLRPMSSMTEEEKGEYKRLIDCSDYTCFKTSDKIVDWLNKNYFDFRGLIPLSLALPATEGMYK